MVLPHISKFLICFSCFHRCLIASCVVCVVFVERFVFYLVVVFNCMWAIQTENYIRLDINNKSNHDRQYVVEELES